MLASAIRALHAHPILDRQAIRDVVATTPELTGSDLAEQVERVQLTPMSLSLDELSKVWSVFFQVPLALAVAYEASVVMLESPVVPSPALPVRERRVSVVPRAQPILERLQAEAGDLAPITWGSTLLLLGRQLVGEDTRLRVGPDLLPASTVMTPTDTRIRLVLDAPPQPSAVLASLRAGILPVQVVHLSSEASSLPVAESNAIALVLRPRLAGLGVSNVVGTGTAPRSARISGTVQPPLRTAQRVALVLHPAGSPGIAHRFDTPAPTSDTASFAIEVSGVTAGTYLVRLQVDGADSPLTADPSTGAWIGPTIAIP